MNSREELQAVLEQEYGLVPLRERPTARQFSSDAKIGQGVEFGRGVIIDAGVEIGDGAKIGNGVRLCNCCLGGKVQVEDNSIIGYETITGGFSKKLEGFDQVGPAVIGDNTLIRTGCAIYQGVTIGHDSHVNHSVLLREHTKIGHHTCIGTMSDSEGYNEIGSHTLIESQVHMCARLTIEDYVFVAPFTVFTNGNPMNYAREITSVEQGPTIRFGTLMAVSIVVLPRVIVGCESLIGAATVVTKDVPPLGIVVGTPGKLRGRVPDDLRMPEALRRQYYDGQLDPEGCVS